MMWHKVAIARILTDNNKHLNMQIPYDLHIRTTGGLRSIEMKLKFIQRNGDA